MGLFSSKIPKAEILKQQHFSINLKCVMPMLGYAKAEFQVHQPDTILMIVDVDQFIYERGLSHLKEEIPYSSLHYVLNRTQKGLAIFAIDRATRQVVTSDFKGRNYFEMFAPAQIWIPEFFDIVEGFPKAVESQLVNDEATLGDKKMTFKKNDELTFNYIENGETLVGISQVRPPSNGLLAFLNAFVEGGRILSNDELPKIPENLVFQQ